MGQPIILNGEIITQDENTPTRNTDTVLIVPTAINVSPSHFDDPIIIYEDNISPIDFAAKEIVLIPRQTSPILNIAIQDIINWNLSYSWGDHSGLYKPLSYVPTWSEILLKPTFATVATSGSYADLLNKPALFSGNYSDLINKPSIFDGNYNSLSNKPSLFDGTWTSLNGKPTSLSSFTNDPGFITTFIETDPTVPSWVKSITQSSITAWDGAVNSAHAHANKSVLDGISSSDIINWNSKQPAGSYLTSFAGLIEEIAFEFRDITPGVAQIYILDIKASFGYTIEALIAETDTGTLTGVSIKIDSTSVTSLSSVTITTITETTSTALKTVVTGNQITINTSTGFTGAPTTLRGKLKLIRT